jgi:hypothetical protein
MSELYLESFNKYESTEGTARSSVFNVIEYVSMFALLMEIIVGCTVLGSAHWLRTSRFHQIDFATLILSILDYILVYCASTANFPFRVLRLFRLLRPVLSMTSFADLNRLLRTLSAGALKLGIVLLVLTFFILSFALFGQRSARILPPISPPLTRVASQAWPYSSGRSAGDASRSPSTSLAAKAPRRATPRSGAPETAPLAPSSAGTSWRGRSSRPADVRPAPEGGVHAGRGRGSSRREQRGAEARLGARAWRSPRARCGGRRRSEAGRAGAGGRRAVGARARAGRPGAPCRSGSRD